MCQERRSRDFQKVKLQLVTENSKNMHAARFPGGCPIFFWPGLLYKHFRSRAMFVYLVINSGRYLPGNFEACPKHMGNKSLKNYK